MSATVQIDRRALMNEAWTIVRRFLGNRETLRALLSRALKSAWFKAKINAAANAAAITEKARISKLASRPSAEIISMIEGLENTDKLDAQSRSRLDDLRGALRIARASEDEKRSLIASASGRFCAVTFIKKDGTERTMQVQPAALRNRIKGDAASEPAKKAVATRSERHPNLFNVWDTQARAPRLINLSTVLRIAVDGAVHTYPA